MATVYIVTAGEYSDYRIERVFLDKDNAYKYRDLMNSKYDDYRVEEYDTSDDDIKFSDECTVFEGKTYRQNTYICYEYDDTGEAKVSVKTITVEDSKIDDFLSDGFEIWLSHNIFRGHKVAPKEYYLPELEKFYKKYCYDKMAYCKSLMLEGFSDREITAFLKKGYKESDNE